MLNFGKSMLNDFLGGFLSDPLGSIVDAITGIFETLIIDPIKTIWGDILKAIYMLWSTMASILDTIQIIYNMMVGTSEVVWLPSSSMGQSVEAGSFGVNVTGVTHNLVLDVFLSEYVLGALLKVVVLSLFLLLIFTMMAVVKMEYSEPHNYGDTKTHNNTSKRPVIERAIKALLSFILIPLACIFGVIASGVLMQALDGATSPTDSTVISNKLFAICAHDANRVRIDGDFYAGLIQTTMTNENGSQEIINDEDGQYEPYDLSNNSSWNPNFASQSSRNKLAEYVDDLFIHATSLQKAGVIADESGEYKFKGTDDKFSNFVKNGSGMNNESFFNSKNASQVFYFYDLTHFQWLIGFFTIFYMGTILIRITLGAAGRVFELAILFVVSPAILSMAPLDGGEAMKKWKGEFIGRVVMIYAPVVAINLYFILVGVLVQVDFTNSLQLALAKGFSGNSLAVTLDTASDGIMNTGLTAAFIQQIFNLFILIAGLQVCESSMKWLGGMIGAKDIMESGENIRKKMGDFVQTNAAAKYLMSGANKMKAGALSVASKPGAKLKEMREDHKNKGVNTAKEAALAQQYNQDKTTLTNKEGQLKTQQKNFADSVKTAKNNLGMSNTDLAQKRQDYATEMAKLANRTDLTEQEKSDEARRNIGISDAQADDWFEYNSSFASLQQTNADLKANRQEQKDLDVKLTEDMKSVKESTRGMSEMEKRNYMKYQGKPALKKMTANDRTTMVKGRYATKKGKDADDIHKKMENGPQHWQRVRAGTVRVGTFKARHNIKNNVVSATYKDAKNNAGGGDGGKKK